MYTYKLPLEKVEGNIRTHFSADYVLTSVNPVHNAQVCYFNNVWLMFLVFKKYFSF
jgi:hypothetical protein